MASEISDHSPVDTDDGSIECFQNYTASEVFIQGLAGLVDQQDVESMIRAQKQILQRFEKTNEMLSNCNALSASRLTIAGQQFKNYKQILIDIKKDLDYSFKKINVLKTRLQTQFPKSVIATSSKIMTLEEESKPYTEELGASPDVDDSHDEGVDSLSGQFTKKNYISDSDSRDSGNLDAANSGNSNTDAT